MSNFDPNTQTTTEFFKDLLRQMLQADTDSANMSFVLDGTKITWRISVVGVAPDSEEEDE